MLHGRWPNGWNVTDVVRWLESNFEIAGRLPESARARFLQRWGEQDAKAAANLPEADKAFPEAKLDKSVGEMLGTLKSSNYLEGHLDNYGGALASRPDFDALVESHHGTRYIHGSLAASILGSDSDPESFKENEDAGLGSVPASAFIVDGNDLAGQDFVFPLGALPPPDLGPPPVI